MGMIERMRETDFAKALRRLYGSDGEAAARSRIDGIVAASGLGSREGAVIVSAPGRTELGGNHTDHNDGRVLAAAVRLDAVAVCAPRADSLVELASVGYPEKIRVDLSSLEPRAEERGGTAALIRGVARYFADRGLKVGGFDARMESLVPPGSGLSSSACVEVLFGAVFSQLYNGGKVEWTQLALAGRYAENDFFGKPCGLMDQMASAGGGVLAIDFQDRENPAWKRVKPRALGRDMEIAIVRTGGSHAELTPHYASIPNEMRAVASLFGRAGLRGLGRDELLGAVGRVRASAGDRAFLRALHFVEEDARAEKMATALASSRLDAYLSLVRASGASSALLLQNLDAGMDPRSQGILLALALAERCYGGLGVDRARVAARGRCAARVHGGGFAGTIQAYVPADMKESFRELMESAFGAGCVVYPGLRAEGAVRLA